MKDKFSAEKIEEANRLLNQSAATSEKPQTSDKMPELEAEKIESTPIKPISTENTEGVQPPIIAPRNTPKVEKIKSAKPNNIKGDGSNSRGIVRITVDMPVELHEKFKIKMILSKQTMKDYLIDFIKKDLQ